MKKIPLTQGKFALVDDEDYERLVFFKWFAYKSKNSTKSWYARRNTELGNPNRKCISMHRAVLGISELDPEVDHRDCNGLNNQKHNLRYATRSGNAANMIMRRDNKSGFKGVYLAKRNQKWAANITTKGKQLWLGYFETAEEAARIFDKAALKYHGEFARTNFPKEDYL